MYAIGVNRRVETIVASKPAFNPQRKEAIRIAKKKKKKKMLLVPLLSATKTR
jgi:hypothetical protein